MFRVHGGYLSIHCPSHIPRVNLGLRGTTLHTCSSQPNNFPPTVLSPNNQLKVYLPLELCVFLIYAMPTGGGESAKTGSEKWAIWWQTAMSLLCSEAWAMSRVITVTGCLFFPRRLPAGRPIMDPVTAELWPVASRLPRGIPSHSLQGFDTTKQKERIIYVMTYGILQAWLQAGEKENVREW